MTGTDQFAFESWVERTVAAALERPHTDFASLTHGLPGIYPEHVLRALNVLKRSKTRFSNESARLAATASHKVLVPTPASGLLGFPPPHPLDFEWRFSLRAIRLLARELVALTSRGDSVALVGTPTLAAMPLLDLQVVTADYYGLDGNVLSKVNSTEHLRHIHFADLLRPPDPHDRYATVVMDPPWYEEHVYRFIFFAAAALQLGGHLLLAMPPSGTRPGIGSENHRIREWAASLGLSLVDSRASVLPYETPPFERNALRAAGIMNVGAEWRRGDLWTLRKGTPGLLDWPGDIAGSSWKEFAFGTVRIRVCADDDVSSDSSLRSVVEGDVLPTVSRRDARRAAVNVWTTGNRVFACDAPARFASLVQVWRQEGSTNGEQSAREQFFSLIRQERLELAWPEQEKIECGAC